MIEILSDKYVDQVMQIWLSANLQAHDFVDKGYFTNNFDLVKTEYLPNAITYIYLDKEKVLGFISVVDDAYIGALFVDTKNQNLGVGTKLLQHVKAKHGNMKLKVYKENQRAVQFYQTRGFQIAEETMDDATKKIEYVMTFNQ